MAVIKEIEDKVKAWLIIKPGGYQHVVLKRVTSNSYAIIQTNVYPTSVGDELSCMVKLLCTQWGRQRSYGRDMMVLLKIQVRQGVRGNHSIRRKVGYILLCVPL